MKYIMQIYTPRYGHTDDYEVIFERDTLTFKSSTHLFPEAVLTHVENRDPVWNRIENINDMLNNDRIYPPHIFPDLLRALWREWRNSPLKVEVQDTYRLYKCVYTCKA